MTIVAISQSNYLPWKGYFQLISKADIFVFYDTADFSKNVTGEEGGLFLHAFPQILGKDKLQKSEMMHGYCCGSRRELPDDA